MQKNWYIVYTKKSLEKKVSGLLTKKKIENYFPVNCRRIKHFNKVKFIEEPLIPGYVFVFVPEKDLPLLKKISNVINIVYWKGQPAVIEKEEIELLADFVHLYRNIKVERVRVGLGEPEIINDPIYSVNGNSVFVKSNLVKVNLPSIGFTMIAEVQRETEYENAQFIFSSSIRLLFQT